MRKINCLLFVSIFGFILSGCSREVTNHKVELVIDGEQVEGIFTGTLEGKNTGSGEINIVSDENIIWSYEGIFEDGVMVSSGKIEDYPCDISNNGKLITGTYTGDMLDGIINGHGIFQTTEDLKYEGEFIDAVISGIGNVENMPYTFSYENMDVTGIYTGNVMNGIPDGNGIFNSDLKDIVLAYDGEWKDGELSGNGRLKTNHYTIEFEDVTRTGNYEGTCESGRASGEGAFSAISDLGYGYRYSGMFKDGTFNGYGERSFDEELNYAAECGTYTNGAYTPTKSELLKYMGSIPDYISFEPAEESLKFIDENDSLFLADNKELLTPFYDESISTDDLYKKPDAYFEKIISAMNCRVVQIIEKELYGHRLTWFLCNDKNNNRLLVFAESELPDVYKNSRVSIYGLPIGFASYENAFGAEIDAYVIYAAYIE